jgi:hypothetical protein
MIRGARRPEILKRKGGDADGWVMITFSRIAVVAVVALAAAGCGSSTPTSYNAQVEQNFVSACAKTSGRQDICTKAYECIKARVSFSDFKAADQAASDHKAIDPRVQTILSSCVTQAVSGA